MESETLVSFITTHGATAGSLYRAMVRSGWNKSEALVRAWASGSSSPTDEDIPMIGIALGLRSTADRAALARVCGCSVVEWVNGGEG